MGFRSFCARAVPWLALVLLVCVLLQAALGAYATWSDASYGNAHRAFVHVFELVPLLLAVAGFVSKDLRAGISGVALFILIGAQYGLISAGPDVRPLHIVNAFVILGITLSLAQARWPQALGGRTQPTAAAT